MNNLCNWLKYLPALKKIILFMCVCVRVCVCVCVCIKWAHLLYLLEKHGE